MENMSDACSVVSEFSDTDDLTFNPIFTLTITVLIRHGEKLYANNKPPSAEYPLFDPPLSLCDKNHINSFNKLMTTITYEIRTFLDKIKSTFTHSIKDINAVITSPYMRTRETARLIIESSRMCNMFGKSIDPKILIDSEIGEYLGHQKPPSPHNMNRYDFYDDTIRMGKNNIPPFGESMEDLRKRCMDQSNKLIFRKSKENINCVFIVSHGLILTNMINYTTKVFKNLNVMRIENTNSFNEADILSRESSLVVEESVSRRTSVSSNNQPVRVSVDIMSMKKVNSFNIILADEHSPRRVLTSQFISPTASIASVGGMSSAEASPRPNQISTPPRPSKLEPLPPLYTSKNMLYPSQQRPPTSTSIHSEITLRCLSPPAPPTALASASYDGSFVSTNISRSRERRRSSILDVFKRRPSQQPPRTSSTTINPLQNRISASDSTSFSNLGNLNGVIFFIIWRDNKTMEKYDFVKF